jgi:fatty-acyl-CoA synthase
VAPGEIGECIGHIGSDARSNYTGYADKAATEKKVLHDVFEKGDAWFRTGDLMKIDGDGYIYFVDRIGDTFRWKGENVATSEVSERIAGVRGRPGSERLRRQGRRPGRQGRHGLPGDGR